MAAIAGDGLGLMTTKHVVSVNVSRPLAHDGRPPASVLISSPQDGRLPQPVAQRGFRPPVTSTKVLVKVHALSLQVRPPFRLSPPPVAERDMLVGRLRA